MRPGGIAVSLGGVVAAGIVGALVGYGAGRPAAAPGAAPPVVTFRSATPMPAKPAVPIDPPPTYTPDPGYPPLPTDLTYATHTLHSGGFVWHYEVPVGWVAERGYGPNHTPEVTWWPAAELEPGAPPGGYQLQVAPVGGHSSQGQMISARWTGLQEAQAAGSFTELTQVKTTLYGAWYSYRDPAGRFRLDDFAWVNDPGPDGYVGFEISIAGRRVDQPGLDALLEHVYGSAYRTVAPPKPPKSPSSGPSPSATSGPSPSTTPSSSLGPSGSTAPASPTP